MDPQTFGLVIVAIMATAVVGSILGAERDYQREKARAERKEAALREEYDAFMRRR